MAEKLTVEFQAWEPDAALLNGTQVPEARNVIPAKRGYRSVPSVVAVTSAALAKSVLEVFSSKAMDGTLTTVASTADGIFCLESGSWVSRYSAAPYSDTRYFCKYGDALYCLYGNVLLKQASWQSSFAAVTGTYPPPTGETLSIIRDFLVLGRAGGTDNAIRWSGIDRPDDWPTPGTNQAQYWQADQQIFPDGGKVMAVVGGIGGTDGLVFLERAVQRMTYVGTPYIFQFDPVDKAYGLLAEKSAVVCGSMCCYLSEDGWHMTDGASVKNIGAERVDNWFFDNCAPDRLSEVRGVHDPQRRLAVWSFPTAEAKTGVHDRLLIYSYLLDKWAYCILDTECLYGDYARGLTLEELDGYGNLDNLKWSSLDDAALKNGGRILGAVTTEHKLGSFSGPSLEAVIDTAETGGERIMVHGIRPLVDCGNAQALPIWRTVQANARNTGTYSSQQRDGICYQHLSCDYIAARIKVPAGLDWHNCLATEIYVEKEGGL